MHNLLNVSVGDKLPEFQTPPISRTTLALFAGGSGDHNPIHIDIDYARKTGIDDVFAQGMLSMAYLGQLLTNWVPQKALRSYAVRFSAITHIRDRISCAGHVAEIFEHDGGRCARIELAAVNQHGEIKLKGEAVVSLD